MKYKSSSNIIKIKISSLNTNNHIKLNKDLSYYYTIISKNWACQMSKPVEGENFSSKYYAHISKEYHDNLLNNLDIQNVANDLKSDKYIQLCATNLNFIKEAKPNAQIAEVQAKLATDQAKIATQKASEAQTILSNKANINLDNLSKSGQAKLETGANKSLDNLNQKGEAKFNTFSNKDLSNLSTIGNNKFNSKANTNLDNTSPCQEFKNSSMAWGIPNYKAGVGLPVNNVNQSITKKGFVLFKHISTSAGSYGYLNDVEIFCARAYNNAYADTPSLLIPVDVGNLVRAKGAMEKFIFYPMKGAT